MSVVGAGGRQKGSAENEDVAGESGRGLEISKSNETAA